MAVRFVAAAARDLGIDPLDAIELLAGKQNYPMNGLLDEETVLLLKRYHEGHGVEATGARPKPESPARLESPGHEPAAPPPMPLPPPLVAAAGKGIESTSVTTPMIVPSDDLESRTVILPPHKE